MTIPKDDLEKLFGTGSELQRMAKRFRAVSEPSWLKAFQVPEIMSLSRKYQGLVDGLAGSPAMRAMQTNHANLRDVYVGLGPLLALGDKFSQAPFAKMAADLGKISESFRLATPALKVLALPPNPLFEQIAQLKGAFAFPELKGIGTFAQIAEISRAADSILGQIGRHRLGDRFGIADSTRLELGTFRLNKSYATLVGSVASAPEAVGPVPLVIGMPARSVYAHARAVSVVTTHDEAEDEPVVAGWSAAQEEAAAVIEEMLSIINPPLLVSWKGAWSAVQRRGPDWARQASASFRYVLIETLERIAPKGRVLEDGVDRRHLYEGRPTRLGQVAWLCRSIKSSTYRKMVFADLESALTIITTMNEAVHDADYPEVEEAFSRMCVRADVALHHLLVIYRTLVKGDLEERG